MQAPLPGKDNETTPRGVQSLMDTLASAAPPPETPSQSPTVGRILLPARACELVSGLGSMRIGNAIKAGALEQNFGAELTKSAAMKDPQMRAMIDGISAQQGQVLDVLRDDFTESLRR